MNSTSDILIIGAGMSGLYAASLLSAKGKKVTLLEARNYTGGRVQNHFGASGNILQAGPEFVHGNLPLTQKLLKKAGAAVFEMEGEMYRSQNGKIFQVADFAPGMDEFMKKLKELEQDTDLKHFLDTHFKAEKYAELRKDVMRMAEGFDAASADRISAKSIYEEWTGGSIETSYQIRESYSVLVRELTRKCLNKGCTIALSKEVKQINWGDGLVTLTCKDRSTYTASKVIVAVPLGVLTAQGREAGTIHFEPAITSKIAAAKTMGYGSVVKVLMEFSSRIWDREQFSSAVRQIPDLGFLLNESDFPVFWMSNKKDLPLVTAWAGGSRAKQLEKFSDRELAAKAVSGFADAMLSKTSFIKAQLNNVSVFNWAKDPFAKGAYSYTTPQTKQARKVLAKPLKNSLFFAGEALGRSSGTVEAALESARKVVKQILKKE